MSGRGSGQLKASETGLCRSQLVALGAEHLADILFEESKTNKALSKRLEQAIPTGKSAWAKTEDDGDEPHMVGASPPMQEIFESIRRFAATDAPVLITGESGTGKELAALALHERSKYGTGPFVAINCAGVPPTLIASELFGHEKGAFTGAHQRRIGRIEAAHGGTLFLDEIGDLPVELQPHLLRFLQEKTIERVGGHQSLKLDVRVISATHENLERLIGADRFRADLFYRLNVLSIEMPALRDRGEDLALLSRYFLQRLSREMNLPPLQFEPDALRAINNHTWPGNVRELISSIRRALVMAEDDRISAADLGLARQTGEPGSQTPVPALDATLETIANGDPLRLSRAGSRARRILDAGVIREALEKNHHNVSHTAKHLGVSRVTLYRHLRKHNIRTSRHT